MFDFGQYHKAHSAAEAVRLLTAHPGAFCLAGGTDVLVRLRAGRGEGASVVDIHDLEELRPIVRLGDGTLRLGAGATFTDMAESPVLRECAPLLAEAAASVAGPQIRNVGTLGGNLCNGAVSADMAAPVLACDAVLRVLGPDGERRVRVEGFHAGPGQVSLKPGDLLLSVDIPAANWQGYGGHYQKYAMREAMDIAAIGCACMARVAEGRVRDMRMAFSVAAPVPVRCPAAEAAARGRSAASAQREALLSAVREAVVKDVRPRTSWRASADFRVHIIRTLAGRVLEEALRRVEAAV